MKMRQVMKVYKKRGYPVTVEYAKFDGLDRTKIDKWLELSEGVKQHDINEFWRSGQVSVCVNEGKYDFLVYILQQ
jgi:arsenate reductase-like glutaredoxin family protein